jgi:hypothetical protein
VKETPYVIGTRPTRPRARSLTGVLLAVLTVAPLIGCAKQTQSTPATTISAEAVAPACLAAMRIILDGALFRPEDAEVSQLPECKSESEEAIGLAAEQLLRATFDDPTTSASPSPAGR